MPVTTRASVRTHWPFGLLFVAGLALRVLAQVAYRPALLYIDSAKYLVGPSGSEPEGYRVLLGLLDPLGGLGLVATAQHAFGLAMGVALYALLLRRRAGRWLAALAAAPVLLDAYQLQLEQTIMPDVLFETLIVAGLILLLWPRRPGASSRRRIAAAALVLGATVTVREVGAVLVVPVVVFAALDAAPGIRRRAGRAALAAGCFALPALVYMTAAVAVLGHFGLASNGSDAEYGRAAIAADCATLKVPADERALCPSASLVRIVGGVDGLLHNPRSPAFTVPVPAGTTRGRLLLSFSLAVLRQQPLRVAESVGQDALRLFALTRDGNPEITSISRWQFQLSYPTYPPGFTLAHFTQLTRDQGDGAPVAVRPAAAVLRAYQLDGGYTPGPLYLAALVAGLAGALAGLRRRTPAWAGCLLVTLAAVVLLLSSDAFEFSWRYQLPAVVMLPLAGALGVTALRSAAAGKARRTRPASAAPSQPAPAIR